MHMWRYAVITYLRSALKNRLLISANQYPRFEMRSLRSNTCPPKALSVTGTHNMLWK
jgi:hypothetical protein